MLFKTLSLRYTVSMLSRLMATAVVLLCGCATTGSLTDAQGQKALATPSAQCRLPENPTIIYQNKNDVLKVWTVDSRPVYFSPRLPNDAAFLQFRRALEKAGAVVKFPPHTRPTSKAPKDVERWRKQEQNRAMVYSGKAGRVRPINCLEALMVAHQHSRFSQLTQPTEFLVAVLRKQINGKPMLRIYFGAGDGERVPKAVYGLDAIKKDGATGWTYWVNLHIHPIRKLNGKLALGSPSPSTPDVDFYRKLNRSLGLARAWITNGFYTADIPAGAFHTLHTHE